MVEHINDTRTATALRLLAKDVEDKNYPTFLFIRIEDDGAVISVNNAPDPFRLIAAMEAEKVKIIDREIE